MTWGVSRFWFGSIRTSIPLESFASEVAAVHCPRLPELEKQASCCTGSASSTASQAETQTINKLYLWKWGGSCCERSCAGRYTLDYQHLGCRFGLAIVSKWQAHIKNPKVIHSGSNNHYEQLPQYSKLKPTITWHSQQQMFFITNSLHQLRVQLHHYLSPEGNW